jgi:thioredoxin-like negative regulator of GroEL
MKDVICLNIDAESEAGAPLAKKFGVRGYPALILLAPDGKVEDNIGGYLKPDKFKTEIQRVRSGEGTVGGLRKKVAANPSNMDLRYQLASKLESLGDPTAMRSEVAEIRSSIPRASRCRCAVSRSRRSPRRSTTSTRRPRRSTPR